MNLQDVKPNLRVRTTKLEDTTGMLIQPKYLAARRSGKRGTVKGFVAGHGGDVWWVEHEDGTVGAYCFTEFEEGGGG